MGLGWGGVADTDIWGCAMGLGWFGVTAADMRACDRGLGWGGVAEGIILGLACGPEEAPLTDWGL